MGRRDRERRERISSGQEEPRSRAVAEVDRARMRRTGYNALQAMGTGNQIKVLRDSLHQGRLTTGKLRKVLEENAYEEMRKGVVKLRRQGKPVTVDALLAEYRKDRDFRDLAGEVGLDEAWFIALAERECAM